MSELLTDIEIDQGQGVGRHGEPGVTGQNTKFTGPKGTQEAMMVPVGLAVDIAGRFMAMRNYFLVLNAFLTFLEDSAILCPQLAGFVIFDP